MVSTLVEVTSESGKDSPPYGECDVETTTLDIEYRRLSSDLADVSRKDRRLVRSRRHADVAALSGFNDKNIKNLLPDEEKQHVGKYGRSGQLPVRGCRYRSTAVGLLQLWQKGRDVKFDLATAATSLGEKSCFVVMNDVCLAVHHIHFNRVIPRARASGLLIFLFAGRRCCSQGVDAIDVHRLKDTGSSHRSRQYSYLRRSTSFREYYLERFCVFRRRSFKCITRRYWRRSDPGKEEFRKNEEMQGQSIHCSVQSQPGPTKPTGLDIARRNSAFRVLCHQ